MIFGPNLGHKYFFCLASVVILKNTNTFYKSLNLGFLWSVRGSGSTGYSIPTWHQLVGAKYQSRKSLVLVFLAQCSRDLTKREDHLLQWSTWIKWQPNIRRERKGALWGIVIFYLKTSHIYWIFRCYILLNFPNIEAVIFLCFKF